MRKEQTCCNLFKARQAIQLFEERKVRTVWDDENEKWYFSIVDVVAVLTESKSPQAYWRKFKQRLIEEGIQSVTNCHGFKIWPRAHNLKTLRV